MGDRVILHCDCNSFFASVETVSHPEYRDVPMAVCGDPDERHGIVLAKNELAKSFGVVTAETIWSARRKCPKLVIAKPHYDEYVKFYRRANEIYGRYTDLVEPFSIDESWLDVTGSTALFGTGFDMAERIRREIREELGITVSIGVSFNKVFAKMGSDYKKPDATTVITRENFRDLLYPLPCTDLLFLGKSTAQALLKCNIRTIGDIANASPEFLIKKFGKAGEKMYIYARGEDTSEVVPADKAEDAKSVGNGMTFRRDITRDEDVRTGIEAMSEEVAFRLRKQGMKALCISLTIKDTYLLQTVRSMTVDTPTDSAREIAEHAYRIYSKHWNISKPIRMLTVTASTLVSAKSSCEQLSIFDDNGAEREKNKRIENTLDKIRERYGKNSIVIGSIVNNDLGIESYRSHSKDGGMGTPDDDKKG